MEEKNRTPKPNAGELPAPQSPPLPEERVVRLEKGKRGLLNILFGRTTIILILLLAQILLLLSATLWLDQYLTYAWTVSMVVAAVLVLWIANREGDPTAKLTWMVLILAAPLVGAPLYIFVQTDLGHRAAHQRLEQILAETRRYARGSPGLAERLAVEDRHLRNLADYTTTFGGYPVYENTQVRYFPSGERFFTALLAELEKAEHFIFLEFFIIQEGYMWGRVLEILERKVRAGVEVRVLYDGTCAIYKLPYSYPKRLRELGIQCKMFMPLRPLVSTHYNNRDHRKIVVVDGKAAFTGGVNLADEYINRRHPFGHWKDAAVLLQGEAVRSFTLMFLQLWHVDEKWENYERYLSHGCAVRAQGYVIPFADSPLDGERVGEMVYLDILSRARRYVHIMTPYLILDGDLITALCFAAKRGVDVALLLPAIPDKEFAYALAKTHYPQLLRAGVRIYEYSPGFVHSKVMVSDDCRAVVGTINLDYRSLYHHFECAAYLQEMEAVADAEEDFQAALAASHRVRPGDRSKEPLFRRLTGWLLKLLAPLM